MVGALLLVKEDMAWVQVNAYDLYQIQLEAEIQVGQLDYHLE